MNDIIKRRPFRPHRLKATGPDYLVWHQLQKIRAHGAKWGAGFGDFIKAAQMLHDLGDAEFFLELWPKIRSRTLRSYGAEVATAARWIKLNPDHSPTVQKIWPYLFP